MLQNMWTTFITEKSLFIKLFVEHIEISLIAILIAIVLGGVVGILICEINFRSDQISLYDSIHFHAWFFDSILGVGNATAVIALLALVMDLILGL